MNEWTISGIAGAVVIVWVVARFKSRRRARWRVSVSIERDESSTNLDRHDHP